MPLTLDEIMEYEERLRREIVERECLLAALKVLHGYAANGQGPKSIELGSLVVSALTRSTPHLPLQQQAAPLPPPPPALPAQGPVTRYIHPELKALASQFGNNCQIVWWAIERMTENFSLRDIRALLEREGYNMRSPQISVVLTRLKRQGRIEEVEPSRGPIPAVFGKPEGVTPPGTKPVDPMGDMETTTAYVAAT